MASYEQLSLSASDNLLMHLPRATAEAITLYIDDINKANYPFPGKHYNLSISDAYYIYNNINDIMDTFQDMSIYWTMPDMEVGVNARPDMGKRVFTDEILPFAQRFIYYVESMQSLSQLFSDDYGVSFQIVYYRSGGHV